MSEFINLVKTGPSRHPFQLEVGAASAFREPNIPPTHIRHPFKDAFGLSTFLLIGAAAQAALILVLPFRVAMAPTIILIIYRLISTSLQAGKIIPTDYMKDVIPGKTSVQFPSQIGGRFGNIPASHPVVVFNLAVRFNHPLGVLAPGAKDIASYFQKMNKALANQADEYGTLGVSSWQGSDRADSNTMLIVFYFRDIDGLNRFAHSDVHRKGWDWYNRSKHAHIGIMHETFCVPAGAYESVYVNMAPTLMGATTVKIMGDGSADANWVRPLVAADKGALKSQFGRMGKSAGNEHEKYGAEPSWGA